MLENEMRELPEDIGPHEGKEFMLMRAGEKDVALFFEIEPEELTEVLSEGFCMLKFPQFEHLGATFFTWIVFRKGFENEALRLKGLVEQSTSGIDSSREHEIGEILSYSRKQLDAYVQHALQTSK